MAETNVMRQQNEEGTKIVTRSSTRAAEVIRLLDEWMADASGYDENTWSKLKKALDQNRLSSRKLFDE